MMAFMYHRGDAGRARFVSLSRVLTCCFCSGAGMPSMPRFVFKPAGASVTRVAISLGDITVWRGDAIVNAANERLLGGGGVDGAIHRAAGPALLRECRALPTRDESGARCATGDAVLTGGHGLPGVRFVIHTVGPNLSGRNDVGAAATDDTLLDRAYQSSLALAQARGLRSIAFPAISCGVFAYPLEDAARIAINAARTSGGHLELIEFVLFGRDTYDAFLKAANAALLPV